MVETVNMRLLTIREKAALLAAYIGSKIELNVSRFSFPVEDRIFILYGVTEAAIQVEETGLWYDIVENRYRTHNVFPDKLLLRRLSEITDEDVRVIAKLKGITSETFSIEEVRDNLNVGTLTGREIDYLRSKGYDCGFGEILSLIDAGIAVNQPTLVAHDEW